MTIAIGVAIILIAIGITSTLQPEPKALAQVITVGPVWSTDAWMCTSDEDFMIYGSLRGLAGSLIEINISDVGVQSLYGLDAGQLEPFSVGASGDNQITITRTGTVTGFITMQTSSGATASCTAI